jgi:hypothetical protein
MSEFLTSFKRCQTPRRAAHDLGISALRSSASGVLSSGQPYDPLEQLMFWRTVGRPISGRKHGKRRVERPIYRRA